MRTPSYSICLVLFVLSSSVTAAAGQTVDTGKSQSAGPAADSAKSQAGRMAPGWQQAPAPKHFVPLPPARHGQPAFSFSGGKRVSTQQTTVDGLRDYSGGSGSGGTGIVEIGKDKAPPPFIDTGTGRSSTGIVEIGAGKGTTGIGEIGAGKGTTGIGEIGVGKGTAGAGVNQVPAIHDRVLSGNPLSTKKAAPAAASALKSRTKPATTVVQLLGADGKMEYKEVPFMGTLPANKRDANVIEVKDGGGKVKEYDWLKKNK